MPTSRLQQWWDRLRSPRPSPWRPDRVPDLFDDFDTTIAAAALHEGCGRLGVAPFGALCLGYSRRSVASAAVGSDGSRSWVKVSGLRGRPTHWLRDGELSADRIDGVPRPALLRTVAWTAGNVQYAAMQWSLVEEGALEAAPWAGDNSARVTDAWIVSAKDALAALGQVPTERWRYQADEVAWMIREQFGRRAPNVADEWRTAHGDLQWSNLSAPNLMLFDWESWGRAPRGYDAAYLVATACAYPDLVARLERAFAGDLETPSGRVARLAALANLIRLVEGGWLDPAYKRPLNAMGRRILAAR